jgi:hypothetical protein
MEPCITELLLNLYQLCISFAFAPWNLAENKHLPNVAVGGSWF